MQRSLEAYQRSGNLERQAVSSSNLGIGAVGRPLGRGPVLLRRGSRGDREDRQHGQRRSGAPQYRRDPERPWRVAGGRSAPPGIAALLEGVAVSLLPGPLPLAARTAVAPYGSLRRGAQPARGGQVALHARRSAAGRPRRRRADRRVPRRHGQCRRRPRPGARHARARGLVERRVQGGSAAGARARPRAAPAKAICGARGTLSRRASLRPGSGATSSR